MKKVIEFRIDCDRLADEEYGAGLQNKLKTVLDQLRARLNPSQITAAKVAEEKERKRIAGLPELSCDDDDQWFLGEKKFAYHHVKQMKEMPDMTSKEAHVYLKKIAGIEWNTLNALDYFNDWVFLDNNDGTFRGSDYETDEEIRVRLEAEAKAESEKLAKAERNRLEKVTKSTEAKSSPPLKQEEPASGEPAEPEYDEHAEKLNSFRFWLADQGFTPELRERIETVLREGLEIPLRQALAESLVARGHATDAEANEVCDMLEAYELHCWYTEADEETAEAQV